MSPLPPLPKGATLDVEPPESALPPLPEGAVMDSAPAAPAQMMASHVQAPSLESMSSHRGAASIATPIDQDFHILSKMIGPQKAMLAIKSSDYEPGMITKLTQPSMGAVNYLNNLTGGLVSGARDVTLGQAQTVMKLLNKIGLTSDEQVALNEGLVGAREQGLQASGTPRFGRFVGNAATALSPVSLAGKAGSLAQAVRDAKLAWAAKAPVAAWLAPRAAAGAVYGTAGSAVQPNATPESVMTGGLAGAVAGPAVEGTLGAVQKGATKLAALGKAPAAQEVLDTLGQRLGGKSPGEALQDAANVKYNAAWDEFKSAIAPVDTEAGAVRMDYKPAIAKIEEVLGIGKNRSPIPIPKERREVLEGLLANLKEAGSPEGSVDNSFAGAIDAVKWLGSEQRRLAVKHGDTEARAMLQDVRDSILKAMEQSNPEISAKYQEARKVFATKVAPLFDKSEGGNYLTQVRDTATPGDLLASGNQGSLARMKPDRAAIIAKGSSADPLLYSYLDAAISQAKGNPGSFQGSISKAMPAIEAIADPEMLAAFKGLEKVAKTSKFTGWLANMGIAGASPAAGAVAIGAHFKPAYSAPGLVWKLLQAPSTRKLLSTAGKLSSTDPALDLIGRDLAKTLEKSIPAMKAPASNITPLRLLPAAASTGTSDQIAENK